MPSKKDTSELIGQIPRSSPVQDVFGWTVPVEQIPLPSNGVLYPKTSALYGRETVQIKAMTAQEEDILMSRALIKEGTVIQHLIKSCLIDRSIDPEDFLIGDRNAVLVAIRITGYGSDYRAPVTCPSCSKLDTHTFDLASLGIKRLTVEPIAPGVNEFEFKLPVTGKKVTFKLISSRDEEEDAKTRARMQQLFPDAKNENDVTRILERQIVSIDGHRERTAISAFIKAMPARDSRDLRSYMSKIDPGIDMSVDVKCRFCGGESKVGLPIGVSFFWPE